MFVVVEILMSESNVFMKEISLNKFAAKCNYFQNVRYVMNITR